MLRLVTALNTLIGTLAIGIAVLLPPLYDALWVKAARDGAEKRVLELVEAEKRAYQGRERFVHFTSAPQDVAQVQQQLGIALGEGSFVFDAFADADNALVIRAFTAPGAVQRGNLPPMLYRYRLREAGADGSGEWVRLSGRSPGLLNLAHSLIAML